MADTPDGQGQIVNLITAAEWAAHEGNDKNFSIQGSDKGYGESVSVIYAVPAGKTLYLFHGSFYCVASNAEDGDNNSIGAVIITSPTVATKQVLQGGSGGGPIALPRPLRVDSETILTVQVYSYSNHDCHLGASLGGYEI